MKKIIHTMIIIWLWFGFVSANDCQSVVMDDNKTILTKTWWFDDILPKGSFEKAVNNLQNFCCTINKEMEFCDNIKKSEHFPNSVYLFDHIFDIIVRRLDAKEQNQNGEDLIYGLKPDKDWQEWRQFITKQANDHNGSVPANIANTYKKYRSIKDNVLDKWDPNKKIWSDEEFSNYKTWTLAEKYNWACETSLYLYLKKIPTANKKELLSAYNKCTILIQNRIKNEYTYTNAIIEQKWNTLLSSNMKAYLGKQFLQNKLPALQDLIFNIKTLFIEVNNAIPKLIGNCTK